MKTKDVVACGFFAALISISAMISIPLFFTPIPFTLQVMAVCITGALLGPKKGTAAVAVYILLGCLGLPVFSGFQSGFGVLFGVTGGFIIGFLPAAFVIGFFSCLNWKKGEGRRVIWLKTLLTMAVGLLMIYLFGAVQYMILAHSTLTQALLATVVPFVLLDCIKILLAAMLVPVLKTQSLIYNLQMDKKP